MTNDNIEAGVKSIFVDEALEAPSDTRLAIEVRSKVEKTRKRRVALATLGVATVTSCLVLLASRGAIPTTQPSATDLQPSRPDGDGVHDSKTIEPSGPLPHSGSASCVEPYSMDTLAARHISFDGTIQNISPTESRGGGKQASDYAEVAFAVNRMFRGPRREQIVVLLPKPDSNGPSLPQAPPPYEVGMRLLVSGERLSVKEASNPYVAWGCGFTRYWDSTTADHWDQAGRRVG